MSTGMFCIFGSPSTITHCISAPAHIAVVRLHIVIQEGIPHPCSAAAIPTTLHSAAVPRRPSARRQRRGTSACRRSSSACAGGRRCHDTLALCMAGYKLVITAGRHLNLQLPPQAPINDRLPGGALPFNTGEQCYVDRQLDWRAAWLDWQHTPRGAFTWRPFLAISYSPESICSKTRAHAC